MTSAAHVRLLAVKEARALLPIWIGCLVVAVGAPLMQGIVRRVSVPALGFGVMALGAYSFGHEYVHRTMGLMLTLPVERRRIFLVKMTVLAAMVLPLAGLASLQRVFINGTPPSLVAAIALGLAPAMTMRCRNALAGAMFSIWLSTMLLIAVLYVVVGRWDPTAEAERDAFAIWTRMMIVVCAGGAVVGWRLFGRLDWNESAVRIAMPSWITMRHDSTPGRPMWQLIKKDLRLQRIAFGTAALYVVASAAEAMLRLVRPHDLPILPVATIGYWLCLPVLIGSIAIAEERQLGTLSSQLLLPLPAWKQWAAKAGSVFGLALLLGVAVPVVVLALLGDGDRAGYLLNVRAATLTLVLAAVGLYVSSLSSSAVIAVAASFCAITASLWLGEAFAQPFARALFQSPFAVVANTDGVLAVVAVVAVLLVRLAYVNLRDGKPALF